MSPERTLWYLEYRKGFIFRDGLKPPESSDITCNHLPRAEVGLSWTKVQVKVTSGHSETFPRADLPNAAQDTTQITVGPEVFELCSGEPQGHLPEAGGHLTASGQESLSLLEVLTCLSNLRPSHSGHEACPQCWFRPSLWTQWPARERPQMAMSQ